MEFKDKEWKIYCRDDQNFLRELADQIIGENFDKSYEILKVYKDDKRSYIAKISYKKIVYLLKFPKNEYNIPQRKIMSIFKKGEALNTFIRTNYYKSKGLDILADVYLVAVKRKFLMISDSFMITEFIEGEETQPDNPNDVKKIKNALKQLHSYGLKHGDANPRNFIIDKFTGKLKVIDTQLKKDFAGIGRNYDFINLYFSEVESALEGTVDKESIAYKIAYFLKKMKRLKVIAYIKKLKKDLRNRGWKI